MRSSALTISLGLIVLTLAACTSSGVFIGGPYTAWEEQKPAAAERYRVFLMGDGAFSQPGNPTQELLRNQLKTAGANSAVILLGDNLYCCGMPDSADRERPRAEAHLRAQLDVLKEAPGRVFVIPGNHDWSDRPSEGLRALKRQEEFVEAYLQRGNVFLPDDGFPGPVKVKLTDQITLMVIDTQWWLETGQKSFGDTGEFDLREAGDFLAELQGLLTDNRNKDILVVGHHPLFSNGRHGGYFPARDHLTPIPVIGSLSALYRRYIGRKQDLSHARYVSLRQELEKTFHDQKLIYAAGHERNLQYFRGGETRTARHYIVSGAGASTSYVARGRGAAFTAERPGFVTLSYREDNSIWMEAWARDGDGASGILLFRHRLKDATSTPPAPAAPPATTDRTHSFRDSTIVTAINPAYARIGGFGRVFMGSHRRDLWAVPVAFPVLDVRTEKEGLTPVKTGGVGQSTSIRLEGNDGHEYVLRSVDKVAGKIWPLELRNTVAKTLTQDQFSMLHPYGALIVPVLADAVQVYHTNPRLVYVPDDPALGEFRDVLAGQIALFEERPDGDMSHVASMGNAPNVISYHKMYAKIEGDNDHRVDQRALARSRLFDLLIGDSDRHFDQWRWAVFEPSQGPGKIYRPIPRDRDLAFMRLDGVFPSIYKLLLAPRYQSFLNNYGYLKGLIRNGLPQDRRLTSALTRSDWLELADSMRVALSDSLIEAAVKQYPKPIFEKNGQETIDILKVRRDKLPDVAQAFYKILADVVDIMGSNKHERFEVTRLSDEETMVVVYKTSKKGEIRKELFRRTFLRNETREIRLYGMGGRDQFIVRGEVENGIQVRAIGGNGQDVFVDESRVAAWGSHTYFYDTDGENVWTPGPDTRIVRSSDPSVNDYEGHKYNLTRPVTFFGRNKDDGVFIGGGFRMTRHGFRKSPHAQLHQLMGNFATRTDAIQLQYKGHFSQIMGRWDLSILAEAGNPNHIRNFYGLGNETRNEVGDATFYQARLSYLQLNPRFERQLRPGVTLHVGPTLEYTDVRQESDRFLATQPGIADNTFEDQFFGGAEAALTIETVDRSGNPKQGVRWTSSVDINVGLRFDDETYSTLATDLALYASPRLSPQVTLALRVGAAHNIGNFPFYGANTLGGKNNLRGHRSTRYAGRSSFYDNVELRLKVFDFAGYVGFGDVGVLGFLDSGRVWADGEASTKWHAGYGGGVWIAFIHQVVLSSYYGLSDDDRTLMIGIGFQY